MTRGPAPLGWLLALTLLWMGAALALTPQQETRAQAVGSQIRCPVCQGLPITESPNDLSHQMMREVRAQVEAGRSNTEIYRYFTARYGDAVLLDPPKSGVTLLLWILPLVAAVIGGGWLLSYARRPRQDAPAAVHDDLSETELARVDAALRERRATPQKDQT